jgi:hypothetical protein
MDVKLKTDQGPALVEGKTAVPFKTFVMLVLQRKIIPLFKMWGDRAIIVDSELLTSIASAPQDSQENRAHLVLVTLGVGILVGIFASAVTLIILESLGVALGRKELLLVAGGLFAVALLAGILSRMQRGNRSQKIADTMERVASLLSK